MSGFAQFQIKEYVRWVLFLHKEQFPYVGRCYAAARREDADKVTDMSNVEALELLGIVRDWSQAVSELYGMDRPNLAILGNDWNHLHAHFIPRRNSPVIVHGREFVDPQPMKNYAPYEKRELPLEFLCKVRDDLKRVLG